MASELGHYRHNLRWGKQGYLALKLDMSKAYDRVKWSFLKQIMLKLGFDPSWTDLVMSCITSVTYSFLVNGSTTGISLPLAGSDKGILSPRIYSFCVQKVSLA